ncbi:MAG: hypothetical protein D6755_12045 [Anaerolineae bacterium]|nr:MAG: hypothetical protein D6755_12045 [Anaerolineae bacterium]
MKRNAKYLLIVVGLVVLVLVLGDFNARIAELNRLRREHEQVATQLAALESTKVALQTQVAYATSDAAVLQNAYEQERMVRPGDVLVVPLPAEQSTPTPVPALPDAPEHHENWEYWYALFFGETP